MPIVNYVCSRFFFLLEMYSSILEETRENWWNFNFIFIKQIWIVFSYCDVQIQFCKSCQKTACQTCLSSGIVIKKSSMILRNIPFHLKMRLAHVQCNFIQKSIQTYQREKATLETLAKYSRVKDGYCCYKVSGDIWSVIYYVSVFEFVTSYLLSYKQSVEPILSYCHLKVLKATLFDSGNN